MTCRDIHELLDLAGARGLPDPSPDGVPCCDAYAYLGPERCLCWEPVHDLPQAPPQTCVEVRTRDRMCADCAFRPGSPERRDSDKAVCDSGDLLRLVHDPAGEFWCHDGLRQAVGYRHPNGLEVPIEQLGEGSDDVAAYQPLVVDCVPYRADGRPALRCAGLAAARRAKDWTP